MQRSSLLVQDVSFRERWDPQFCAELHRAPRHQCLLADVHGLETGDLMGYHRLRILRIHYRKDPDGAVHGVNNDTKQPGRASGVSGHRPHALADTVLMYRVSSKLRPPTSWTSQSVEWPPVGLPLGSKKPLIFEKSSCGILATVCQFGPPFYVTNMNL